MVQFKPFAAILALFVVLVVVDTKPLSETELQSQAENGLNPKDVEELVSLVQSLAEFNEYSEHLSPEARGWWSRFRDNYLKPAIPSIVGAVLNRG